MSDVTTQQAEKVKRQERTAEEQRRGERHRQEQIDQHWPVYWQAVIHTVKQDVATFNAQCPADLSKHLYVETPSTGHELTVRRPSEPPKRAMRLIRAAVLQEGCIRLTLIEITFNPPGGHDISCSRGGGPRGLGDCRTGGAAPRDSRGHRGAGDASASLSRPPNGRRLSRGDYDRAAPLAPIAG
jgi:hypothetical protein